MQLVKVYVIDEHCRKVKLKRVDFLTEGKSKSHQTNKSRVQKHEEPSTFDFTGI